jgi:hypothetical protein
MSTNNFYVYIFLRSDKPGFFDYGDLSFDYEPFYVGKGINDRIKSSLKEKVNNNIKRHIIDKIHQNNMEIKSLKIKLVVKNSKVMPPRSKSFPAQAKSAFENLLSSLEDSPLRHRLIKLIKHHANSD